jgi:phosphoribosylanthranilate isomerase
MPPLVKICGLSTPDSINAALHGGATHIGLVHFEKSPRHVTLGQAAKLRAVVGDRAKVAVLLVNAAPALVGEVLASIAPNIIQFHGAETPEFLAQVKAESAIEIWKATGVKSRDDLISAEKFQGVSDRMLYDAPAAALPGGNGSRFDWSLLSGHRHVMDWGIAGGLSPANVADAIAQTNAPLVDVSSGVESSAGVKDVDKIAAFLKATGR